MSVQIYQSLCLPDGNPSEKGEKDAHAAVIMRFSEPTTELVLTAAMPDRLAELITAARERNQRCGVNGL